MSTPRGMSQDLYLGLARCLVCLNILSYFIIDSGESIEVTFVTLVNSTKSRRNTGVLYDNIRIPKDRAG